MNSNNLRKITTGPSNFAASIVVLFTILISPASILCQATSDRGLQGEVKASSRSVEADLMSYVAVKRAGADIANEVCNYVENRPTNFVIYSGGVKDSIANYQNDKRLLKAIEARFIKLNATNSPSGVVLDAIRAKKGKQGAHFLARAERESFLSEFKGSNAETESRDPFKEATNAARFLDAVTGGLGSISSLISMFRTDIDLSSSDLTLKRETLISEVTERIQGHCRCTKVKIHRPGDLPVNLKVEGSEILSLLDRLFEQDALAATKFRQVDGLIKIIGDLATADEADVALIEPHFSQLIRARAEIVGARNQFAAMAAYLAKLDEKGASNALLNDLKIENVVNVLAKDKQENYILDLEANTAGGTRRIKNNLLLDVFRGYGRIAFSGVAVVRYDLYNNDGSVARSGVSEQFVDFRRASNILKESSTVEINNRCPARSPVIIKSP